jgi:pyruvate,water dikinase
MADQQQFSSLHQRTGPGTAWTTVNAAENIPGVMTPLGATFWLEVVELGMRGAFATLGVLSPDQVHIGNGPDDRFSAVFFGRCAVNVDTFRRVLERTPGASPSAFEEQMLGMVREHVEGGRPAPHRYPVVAAKAGYTAVTLPRRVAARTAEVRAWWRRATGTSAAQRPAAERLRAAYPRAAAAVRTQMVATSFAQALFDRLGTLAAEAGHPDEHLNLMIGYGDTEEAEMIAALYAVARGEASMEHFLDRFGARCPGENELSARSWREDPTPVQRLMTKYARSARPDPGERQRLLAHQRRASEQCVLAGLRRRRRLAARLVFRLARRYIPLREEGKATLAMAMDAARAAARARGVELVGTGAIDTADDVFYLTWPEVLGRTPEDCRSLISERKAERAGYQCLELPQSWIGQPEPLVPAVEPAAPVRQLVGVPGASGVVEGRARVVANPAGIDEVEPDEILVCRTTDPSWGAAFYLVSAVVIDIGGAGSHGAIVAREMGLPCVINTLVGTRVLRTGDLLRVDGTSGTVTVLAT